MVRFVGCDYAVGDLMRAIRFEQFGEPADVLRVVDLESPRPGRGEVRVRMAATPINPSDLMTVRGVYGKLPDLPATPGFEGVGVVEEAGGGLLARWLVGKRVVALNPSGGNWAEEVVIPARQAIPVGDSLPREQAATFFVNPATAYVMTREVLKVPEGAWLLQTAAGSQLGRMVMRLGREYGFRTINIVRRLEQAEELRGEGDELITFDGSQEEPGRLSELIQERTNGELPRYAIDPVGGGTGSAALQSLGSSGRMLVYGTLSDQPLTFSPRVLMTEGLRLEGFWLSQWMEQQGLLAKLKLIRKVGKLIESGVLTSTIGREYPLDRIADAVQAAEETGRSGKMLLILSQS